MTTCGTLQAKWCIAIIYLLHYLHYINTASVSYAHMHMLGGTGHMYVCAWKPDIDVTYMFQFLSTLFFEPGSLSKFQAHCNVWLVGFKDALGATSLMLLLKLYSSSIWLSDILFCVSAGSELMSSRLHIHYISDDHLPISYGPIIFGYTLCRKKSLPWTLRAVVYSLYFLRMLLHTSLSGFCCL